MCCCYSFFYTACFAIIIWVELGCGLVATTTTAFVNDKANVWAYLIFVLDLAFVGWMLHFSGKELFINKTKSSTLNWVCGMCTVVTVAILGGVWFLAIPAKDYVLWAFVVYILAVFALGSVACCYMLHLRLGLDDVSRDRRRQRKNENSSPVAQPQPTKRSENQTMEESLAQIVTHVQNNPAHKGYRMYAPGSETPFEVTV